MAAKKEKELDYRIPIALIVLLGLLVSFPYLKQIPLSGNAVGTAQISAGDYWHSRDHYEVEMDGEGDAFVVAMLEFEGITQKNTSSVTLEVPNTGLKIFSVVQNPSGNNYYNQYGQYQPATPQFLDYTFERLSDSTRIVINLKDPIMANQKTSILLTYQVTGVATKNIQGFDFKFQTIKDSKAMIRISEANIMVPEEMALKGKPTKTVQYKPSDFAVMSSAAGVTTQSMKMYSDYYYARPADFRSTNLDPGESFTITGLYGDNFILLNLFEIILGVFVILLIIFLLPRILSILKPSHKKENAQEDEHSIARPVLMGGIGGSGFVVGYFLAQFLFTLINYSTPNGGAIMVLLVIISAVLVMFPLFYPVFYMKKNDGSMPALITFVTALIIAFVILMILAAVVGSPAPIYTNALY